MGVALVIAKELPHVMALNQLNISSIDSSTSILSRWSWEEIGLSCTPCAPGPQSVNLLWHGAVQRADLP